ncbi:MAG: adenosylcobalamin-dependent ribonucleoside-diphosphate reductase [Aigarchaeota archaeon]|nr:adenosylcobalamin-dependent ribonucleoside-diphosphate reductase [Candidatus Calditenuaceae archaeon]
MKLGEYPVKRIVKRDGRVVDFDSRRIREAIKKAMLSVDKYDENLLDRVVEYVLQVIAEKYGAARTPHVEDVQDIVELALVRFDLYEVAKSYILYRKQRERVRKEKMLILETDYLDEVDKRFSGNALRLMASRYLLKNEEGRLAERPKQLFQRVAALIVIPDILYDPLIFDVEAKQKPHPQESFSPDSWAGKIGLGKDSEGYHVYWNKWHLERMKKLYDNLNAQGCMRHPWSVFWEMLLAGTFDHHYQDYLNYYNLMVEKKFMPNSPTLFNAGARLGQLSACFVLPIEDNIESIMRAATEAAIIFKSGGGIGINYSKLRPEGDVVFSTSGVASGPVTFMRIIDTVTEVVKQGGKRRGANMGILEVWHPDIEKFIRAKEREGVLENFNVSVLIDDKFIECLEGDIPYELRNPRDEKVWGAKSPSHLFHLIAEMAWKTADPGVLYLENINRRNPLRKVLGDIRSTNPCGEEPLYEYESCNLGSVNLYAFVRVAEGRREVDWDGLQEAVKIAYRFLDNVIDVNNYPLPSIDEMSKKTRRVGLGFMGLADLLFALRVPYNSEEGFKLMQKITEFIAYHAYSESIERAKSRGVFPLYWQSSYVKGQLPLEGFYHRELWTMNWDRIAEAVRTIGIRNSFLMSIAPTGSISMLADTSSGLEPVFALLYEKHVTVGVFHYIDPEFENYLKEAGLYNEQIFKLVADNGGSIQGLDVFGEEAKKVFVVAYDIPWWDHVRAQYHVGLWVDAAVSKTINMPSWVTVEDVENAYIFAYKLGLKGITIYRDLSKSSQVLVTPSQRESRYITQVENDTLEIMKRLGIDVKLPSSSVSMKVGKQLQVSAASLDVEPVVSLEVGNGGEKFSSCPECRGKSLVWQEGCVKCLDCGWTSCVIS